MRITLLLCNLLICSLVYAQKDLHLIEEADIARMELQSHRRSADASKMAGLSSASTNFDVKYYRAEWEVNPAVNFIKGKLTAYYVKSGSDNTISFDLVDALLVSNVLQRSSALTISHTNILCK